MPDLIDSEFEAQESLLNYVADFDGGSIDIDLKTIRPLGVVELREVRASRDYEPGFFVQDTMPKEFAVGQEFAGFRVTLAQRSPDRRSLYLCFAALVKPTWSSDEALTTMESHLCILTWHPDPSDSNKHQSVLGVSCTDNRIKNRVLAILDPEEALTIADVGKLQRVIDSLPRMSVSNVGVRSTNGIQVGVAQYVNYSGRGVDRGLGAASMGLKALGHAMIQLSGDGRSINAGIAVEKGKYWELRHMGLVEYWEWVTALISKYWSPGDPIAQRLLPALARGSRLNEYPDVDVLFAEIDPLLVGDHWRFTETDTALGDVKVRAKLTGGRLQVWATDPAAAVEVYLGTYAPGSQTPEGVEACSVWRGGGYPVELADLFIDHPPTLWLLDGTTIRGAVVYERPRGSSLLNADFVEAWDWSGYEKTSEKGSKERNIPRSKSIHAKVEAHLLELYGDAHVELWHSIASDSAKSSLAHAPFQEVCQQGMKSRRRIIDGTLWSTLAERLPGAGAKTPPSCMSADHRSKRSEPSSVWNRWKAYPITPRTLPLQPAKSSWYNQDSAAARY
ncbi:hypothetical protein [Demequina lutea]|uniref:Uncharacterized protein n=1 Tax=Demequina lutea TaxID=431489 RepID=A0A7Y9ZDG2_9MICO|nr:hypothetical protein [Demequina lutea]NYI42830.1 hypothetical protein [Demequina lutea]